MTSTVKSEGDLSYSLTDEARARVREAGQADPSEGREQSNLRNRARPKAVLIAELLPPTLVALASVEMELGVVVVWRCCS